jgi:hypothetical protein
MLNKLLKFLLFFSLIILFVRSGIYIKRTVSEILNPKYNHFENIFTCGEKPINFAGEEKLLWLFRNLGAKCE